MKAYLDTNILVAGVMREHEHHAPANALLRAAAAETITAYISNHSLAEMYAVLTATPWSYPVQAQEALLVIESTIRPNVSTIDLSGKQYEAALHRCAKSGWKGGRIYDALHIEAALHAECDRIYTFNTAHFRQLAPELEAIIQSPS